LQLNLFPPLKWFKSTVAFEGRPHYDFISLSKELEAPMTIYDHMRTYPFRFGNIEKVYETYHGKNVSVRYFVRVAMERKFLPPLVREHEIIVQSCQPEMELKQSDAIKMEVGIEDCLHIEFEYSKRHFHLEDVIYGKVHFLLVSLFLSTPWYPNSFCASSVLKRLLNFYFYFLLFITILGKNKNQTYGAGSYPS
jgi:hypothetical protein